MTGLKSSLVPDEGSCQAVFFQDPCQQPKNVLMELCFGTCSSSVAVECCASSLSVKEGLLRYFLIYSSCIRQLRRPQLTKNFYTSILMVLFNTH